MSTKSVQGGAVRLCVLALLVLACHSQLNYNPIHYPNLVSGYGNLFFNYRPSVGSHNCKFWCQSTHTYQYYCCTTYQQQALSQGSFGNQGAFINQGLAQAVAASYNPSYYPGLVAGYQFYQQRPTLGQYNCQYWCTSPSNGLSYCCNANQYQILYG